MKTEKQKYEIHHGKSERQNAKTWKNTVKYQAQGFFCS